MALLVAGCVDSRDPVTVLTRQSDDQSLTCKQLAMEFKVNSDIATKKIALNDKDDAHDVILGALIWPGLADFKNADGLEGNALLDRNLWLRALAKGKGCDTLAYPAQPARYD